MGNIATEPGARTVTIDTKTHTLFLPTAEFGTAPDAAINPRARPPVKPGTFHVLAVGEK
jgi:hypothetical protein